MIKSFLILGSMRIPFVLFLLTFKLTVSVSQGAAGIFSENERTVLKTLHGTGRPVTTSVLEGLRHKVLTKRNTGVPDHPPTQKEREDFAKQGLFPADSPFYNLAGTQLEQALQRAYVASLPQLSNFVIDIVPERVAVDLSKIDAFLQAVDSQYADTPFITSATAAWRGNVVDTSTLNKDAAVLYWLRRAEVTVGTETKSLLGPNSWRTAFGVPDLTGAHTPQEFVTVFRNAHDNDLGIKEAFLKALEQKIQELEGPYDDNLETINDFVSTYGPYAANPALLFAAIVLGVIPEAIPGYTRGYFKEFKALNSSLTSDQRNQLLETAQRTGFMIPTLAAGTPYTYDPGEMVKAAVSRLQSENKPIRVVLACGQRTGQPTIENELLHVMSSNDRIASLYYQGGCATDHRQDITIDLNPAYTPTVIGSYTDETIWQSFPGQSIERITCEDDRGFDPDVHATLFTLIAQKMKQGAPFLIQGNEDLLAALQAAGINASVASP